ncbi:MAG: NfeD family protein [Niameybacter sp.]|uniref:NfeD family protein n=1 Tax=Niameybacter sp. TaxID=2033640 RepID=UPI002FCCB42F
MWLLWLVVGIAFAIAEIINNGFFLIWFAIGAIAALLTSLITTSVPIQLIVFLTLSFLLLITLTRYCSAHFAKKDTIPTNIDALIGKTGTVLTFIGTDSSQVGQVKLDGEIWSAISSDGLSIEKGITVIVDEIRGVRLIVHPKSSTLLNTSSHNTQEETL